MLNNCSYDLYDLPTIDEVHKLFHDTNMVGFNVTQPYKKTIIPYLDELSEEAEKVQAVNTVRIINGKKIGYNTDIFGFEKSLHLFPKSHQKALILGNGGAAQAVKYVLEKNQIHYTTITRTASPTFEELTADLIQTTTLIVQCTPVGTFPNVEACLSFPFEHLNSQHLVIDLIYNPDKTTFMKRAAEHRAKTLNGLYMLEMQAEKAWEIWNF